MFNLFSKKPKILFYNTLSKKKDLFRPIKKGYVGMYACGPTVYNYAHIGNMRTFIFEDILKRTLQYNGLKVKHVMNITDVGHLTGDRDMGEDKVEKMAKTENKDVWQIAEFYTNEFFKDESALNIIRPDIVSKATDHISEQIEMIKKLDQNGLTYITSDGVYFDTSKINDYGKLTGQDLAEIKEGARVETNPEKKSPTDFALWKFSPKDEKRQMEWQSPWGMGFPGWHIECSAMSVKYLGEHFDIHCGGVDFIGLHHTNEIAQTEGATGKKPWVNFWMHGAFLNIDGGRKMAKSSGDFLTLQNTYTEKGHDPLAYRLACLSVHYRKPMEWSSNVLSTSINSLENLYKKISQLGNQKGRVLRKWKNDFILAINDDLNMPKALAVLHVLLDSKEDKADILATILDFDKVLGIRLEKAVNKTVLPTEELKTLLEMRKLARESKDWQKSDSIRLEIEKLGFGVKDGPGGQIIEKKL